MVDNRGMDIDGMGLDRQPSVINSVNVNVNPMNTSSTLKLTDNDIKYVNEKQMKVAENEKYIPFDHRDKTHATPDYGALVHMLKSSLGSGILAMPNAFLHGGLIFGIVGTIVVGFICTHCVHVLVKCSQILSEKTRVPSLGFVETAEVAFKTGPTRFRRFSGFAREFVRVALFATYYLGNTVYVVFIAKSFQQVVDHHMMAIDIRLWVLLIAIPLFPVAMIRSLKYLVPVSAVATFLIGIGLIMTLYYTLIDLPPIYDSHYIASYNGMPLFFSTVLFAMEGIGTMLPIENSMKKPQHFLGCPGVLNIAMIVVVTLYAAVGFCGYWKYGKDTMGSVTLNLGCSPGAESVKIVVALSILFTYGLQFTVPTDIVWKQISKKINEKRHTQAYYIMRAVMICGTLVIAIIVPQLSPIISLVGAVCFSILGLFTPAMMEIVVFHEMGYGFFKWRLIKNIIIIILAIIALVSGTYASLLDIIHPGVEPDPCKVP